MSASLRAVSAPPSDLRVVHVITCLDVGGAELALKRLILFDPAAIPRQIVVSLRDIGPVGRELQQAGVVVHALHMGRTLSNVSAVFRLARLIRRLNPSLIQTWMYHADLFGGLAALLAGRREVIWGIRQTGFASDEATRTFVVMKLCASMSSWIPRVIVCCAQAARDSHVRMGYCDKAMRVIPNGFALPDLSNVTGWRSEIRKELELSSDSRVIGMIGRFDPLKDHHGFIQAARIVARLNGDARFMLVGRGVDQGNNDVLHWIQDAGLRDKFVLLGERRDIHACLSAMDVFCLSSVQEAFPNVVGEAMAMGLPCVVTAVGDAAHIVGDTGWVVPARDPEKLGNALAEAIAIPVARRLAIGIAARRRIESEFSMTNTHELFTQAYLDACAGRSN